MGAAASSLRGCVSNEGLGSCTDTVSHEANVEEEASKKRFQVNVLDVAFSHHGDGGDEQSFCTAVEDEDDAAEAVPAPADLSMLQSPCFQQRRIGHEEILKNLMFCEGGACDASTSSTDAPAASSFAYKAALHSALTRADLPAVKAWFVEHEGGEDAAVAGGAAFVFANGQTALHLAVSSGDASVVAWMLEKQGDLSGVDVCGRNALHYAYIGGNAKIIDLLLQHGATAGETATQALPSDAQEQQLPSCLLSAPRLSALVSQKDCYGATPLDLDTCSIRDGRSDSTLTTSTAQLPLGTPFSEVTQSPARFAFAGAGSGVAGGSGAQGGVGFHQVSFADECGSTSGASVCKTSAHGTFKSPKLPQSHLSRKIRKTASFVLSSVLPVSVYQRKSQRGQGGTLAISASGAASGDASVAGGEAGGEAGQVASAGSSLGADSSAAVNGAAFACAEPRPTGPARLASGEEFKPELEQAAVDAAAAATAAAAAAVSLRSGSRPTEEDLRAVCASGAFDNDSHGSASTSNESSSAGGGEEAPGLGQGLTIVTTTATVSVNPTPAPSPAPARPPRPASVAAAAPGAAKPVITA